MNQTVAILMQ